MLNIFGVGESLVNRGYAGLVERRAKGVRLALAEYLGSQRIAGRAPGLDRRELAARGQNSRHLQERDLGAHMVDAAADVANIDMAIFDRNFFRDPDEAAKPVLESEQRS